MAENESFVPYKCVYKYPYVNHKYKMIYFPIFKNATHDTLILLEGIYNFKPFTKNDFKNYLTLYKDYFKFTFIRNIYQRFNSSIKYLKKKNIELNKNIIEDFLKDNITNKFNLNHLLQQSEFYNNINQKYIKDFININSCSIDKDFYVEFANFNVNLDYNEMNFIGNIDNLHKDLCKILLLNNIKIIDKHWEYIKLNERKNNTDNNDNINMTDELLKKINKFYHKDFDIYKFKKIENVEEINYDKPPININEIYCLIIDNIIPFESTEIFLKLQKYILDENL